MAIKPEELDSAEVAEPEEHDGKPLDEEMAARLTGGNYGEPSRCPQCGGWRLEVTAELIQGGPDAGRLEVNLLCLDCGYTDWWDW